MNNIEEIERAAARLERSMDEAYSRYMNASEEERVAGVAAGLRLAIESVPKRMRPFLLEMLAERYEPEGPRVEDPAVAAEMAALKAETERLSGEIANAPGPAAAETPVLEALLGPVGDGSAGGVAPDAEEVAKAVGLLTRFAADLARVFLREEGEQFRRSLSDQLGGGERLAPLLEEIKAGIGGQLQALPTVCTEGSRFLLRELDPLMLEERARASGRLGIGPFRFRDLWRAFEHRYSELVEDEDLYQSYFDGHLKKALFRLRGRRRNG